MKILLSLLAAFALTAGSHAQACTDFSGQYVNSEEGMTIDLTIAQSGCASAEITVAIEELGEKETSEMIFDGVMRTTYEDEEVLVRESSQMVGAELHGRMELTDKIEGETYLSTDRIMLDSASNLVLESVQYDDEGQPDASRSVTFTRK